uniref:VWFA domain-containing protein n=1 Tax=Neolamprologus brichardi TaxID=32507 RepID=A0A3Q4H5A8_NEOBR
MIMLNAALGFNIDPVAWKTLSNSAAGFAPDFAVNMSLGLSMKSDPTAQNTVVSYLTADITSDCISLYLSLYLSISLVYNTDFQTMKKFVKDLIESFLSSDTQYFFSFFQFSNFSSSGSVETDINDISQQGGHTYTAKAIRYVVNNVFTPQSGSRPNVKKVLIVITDGQSHDRTDLGGAAQLAESKNIVRFAIGVSITSIVGANEWRGGYVQYTTGGQKLKTYEDVYLEPDSYLGYSMAIAKSRSGSVTVVGAPRYKHRGVVFAVNRQSFENQKIEPFSSQYQTGEYFGAEVCTMDINNDDITDLIFISAPMYMEPDREGRVYVCRLIGLFVECNFDDPLVLRGRAAVKGRFGSSLAVLPDLNSDGFMDLAVGAPLENNGEGSIYIFHSEGGGRISPTYSQRITGSEVQSGLKFFGLSISQSSFDQSGDQLPDLVVGSKGTVVLLRSRPIVTVKAEVSFSPKKIPTQNVECSKPLENTATVCFTMSRVSTVNEARAVINYTLTLDATRKPPNNRAYTSGKQREQSGSVTFYFACRPTCDSTLDHHKTTLLGFEINCGTDNKCVDNLKVDFNFTRSSEVKVGIDELLDVTVTVENRGENSYNSRVILTYPAGLSYRKFTIQQGRIECNSVDSEDGLSRGRTDCTIDKPIFKNRTEVSFIVSYGIETDSKLERKLFVTANATSGNQEHSPTSELYKKKWIDVKYSIFMTFERYVFFCFNKICLCTLLDDKNSEIHLTLVHSFCFIQSLLNHPQDCSVARCRVFKCNTFIERLQSRTYEISANLSLGWIEQTGLESTKFLLTSTASLEYDDNQYFYFSTGSNYNPPVYKIETVPDFIKPIVIGSLGGLAFLIVLTAGLYKAGFFNSNYKWTLNQEEDGPGPGTDEEQTE